jgi:hypothetical protein
MALIANFYASRAVLRAPAGHGRSEGIVLPSSTGLALEMMARAIETSEQLPERTELSPRPLPELEKLAARAH